MTTQNTQIPEINIENETDKINLYSAVMYILRVTGIRSALVGSRASYLYTSVTRPARTQVYGHPDPSSNPKFLTLTRILNLT